MAILSRSGGIRYFYNLFHCVLLSALTYVLSPTNLDHSSLITHITHSHHLNRYFIDFVLKKEQEVYAQEELDIPHVLPRDNEDVLKLLDGRPLGLLPRLDEEVCLRPSQV